jgi:hypothetical protein
MIAALLFLLAAFARADLVDETFEIPASDWRYVPRPLTEEPAMVDWWHSAASPQMTDGVVGASSFGVSCR